MRGCQLDALKKDGFSLKTDADAFEKKKDRKEISNLIKESEKMARLSKEEIEANKLIKVVPGTKEQLPKK